MKCMIVGTPCAQCVNAHLQVKCVVSLVRAFAGVLQVR